MGLTTEQRLARDGKLTASRVACLMTGDRIEIMSLWREMVGDPSFVEDDLSGVWPVQLGAATEELNLRWYERKTGHSLTRRGEVVLHKSVHWAAATLDGWDQDLQCPVEAKHVGGFEERGVIVDRYAPQLHWQMIVTNANRAALSIIEGAREPVIEMVERDLRYSSELWERATAFMGCVDAMIPPFEAEPVAPPVIPEKVYDMTESTQRNQWANEAGKWLEHWAHIRPAKEAEQALKQLVPADAKRAFGYGVEITKNRAGSMALKEFK